jgi:hypothetical protein
MNILVIQEGVYRHQVIGIYNDKHKALEAANHAAKIDVDSHHVYVGYLIQNMDLKHTYKGDGYNLGLDNMIPLFHTKKKFAVWIDGEFHKL